MPCGAKVQSNSGAQARWRQTVLNSTILKLPKGLTFLRGVLMSLCLSTTALGDDDLQVLVFGDSIAAGFGLAIEDGLTGQLQRALGEAGYDALVLNGGVSGDTTAGGLARVAWTLTPQIDVVILVLGGNDALRGLTPKQSEDNLDKLLAALKERQVKILLTGMRAPPNLGPDYAASFEPMYGRLAQRHKIALYPFILEGVAADPDLNQDDGIHPNAKGVAIIVAELVLHLKPLLD
jgi:acyl-CoA thioesterase I